VKDISPCRYVYRGFSVGQVTEELKTSSSFWNDLDLHPELGSWLSPAGSVESERVGGDEVLDYLQHIEDPFF